MLVLLPLLLAVVANVIPSNHYRAWCMPLAGVIHSALTVVLFFHPAWMAFSSWLALDPPGKVVLIIVSSMFLLTSFYAVGYLRYYAERSNRIFVSSMLGLLSLLSLVTLSHHLGLMWVAIEGTTLVTAPLIYFRHNQQSLEATWKYLLVGSVGIALALLGTFFLAYSSLHAGMDSSLIFENLLKHAPALSKPWLHASFVLLLVGYGTKMGLAPMHTWKPDAYGEAPGVVGALFAGAVTSVSFLALLRIYQVCRAAGEGPFVSRFLVPMGLLSIGVAALFIVGQRDLKRLLAYSSVEHMGILVLGVGLGGQALWGAMFHVLTNGLTKGVLFLSVGNIQRAFGSKSTDYVCGAIRRVPLSGSLFLVGFIAISGSPPFGPFISEFSILLGAFASGHFFVGGLFLLFLLIVFIGMGSIVIKVVLGKPPADVRGGDPQDRLLTSLPVVLFMALSLLLGIFIPAPLQNLLQETVRYLEMIP